MSEKINIHENVVELFMFYDRYIYGTGFGRKNLFDVIWHQ